MEHCPQVVDIKGIKKTLKIILAIVKRFQPGINNHSLLSPVLCRLKLNHSGRKTFLQPVQTVKIINILKT